MRNQSNDSTPLVFNIQLKTITPPPPKVFNLSLQPSQPGKKSGTAPSERVGGVIPRNDPLFPPSLPENMQIK